MMLETLAALSMLVGGGTWYQYSKNSEKEKERSMYSYYDKKNRHASSTMGSSYLNHIVEVQNANDNDNGFYTTRSKAAQAALENAIDEMEMDCLSLIARLPNSMQSPKRQKRDGGMNDALGKIGVYQCHEQVEALKGIYDRLSSSKEEKKA